MARAIESAKPRRRCSKGSAVAAGQSNTPLPRARAGSLSRWPAAAWALGRQAYLSSSNRRPERLAPTNQVIDFAFRFATLPLAPSAAPQPLAQSVNFDVTTRATVSARRDRHHAIAWSIRSIRFCGKKRFCRQCLPGVTTSPEIETWRQKCARKLAALSKICANRRLLRKLPLRNSRLDGLLFRQAGAAFGRFTVAVEAVEYRDDVREQ